MSNEKPMRIWGILKYYYPDFSGMAVICHRIFNALQTQGYEVTVLVAQSMHTPKVVEQEFEGIRIRYLYTGPRLDWRFLSKIPRLRRIALGINGVLNGLLFSLHQALILLRESSRDEIIQFFTVTEFSFLVVLLARLLGRHPVMGTTLLGSDDPETFRRMGFRNLGIAKLKAFHYSEGIVNISSALADSCIRAGIAPNKVYRIPPGVETTVFRPLNAQEREQLRLKLHLNPRHRFITFVGSAQERKGIDILIDAFLILQAQYTDLELLIVGPSDFSDLTRYRIGRQQFVDSLKAKCEATGCASRVHWLGTRYNVHEYMQSSDIFVLPTRREGFGSVMIEAMSCGIPIVVSYLEGITTDFVGNSDEAVVVPDYDPTAYASAISQLLEDPELCKKVGYAARKRVENIFSIDQVASEYTKLYRSLQS